MKPSAITPKWLRAFGEHLWRHFLEDQCFEAAGSLSYKTLLALVPLLAVVIGLVSAIGIVDEWVLQAESYIFTHFVPAKGSEIQAYINQFIDRTTGLTASGSLLLIIISVLLMQTIEESFNRIWRVRRQRPLLSRILMYWAVLTLAPLLLGASLILTSYFAVVPDLAPEAFRHALESLLASAAPFFIAWIGFGLMFMVVPNRRVIWQHAFLGALLSAVLFELSKFGFVFYLSHSTTYEHVYGALATVPIFLLWIYVLWVVVLLGASLTAALTTFRLGQGDWRWSRRFEFILLIRLLGHLWHAQARGKSLRPDELSALEPGATTHQVQHLLEQLALNGLVHFDEDNQVILSADLDEWSVLKLYGIDDFVLPIAEIDQLPSDDPLNARIIALMHKYAIQPSWLSASVKSLIVESTNIELT